MRRDYELRVLGSLTDSIPVPDWADYVDIVNDGGRPLKMRVGAALPLYVKTGDRIPIQHDQLQFAVDGDLNSQVPITSIPTLALLSSEVALVTPTPSTTPTESITQEEAIVNNAAARLISAPAGSLTTQPIGLVNVGAGLIYLGETAAAATAKRNRLVGGQPVDWWGPLFVFTDAGANQTLDLLFRVKRGTS